MLLRHDPGSPRVAYVGANMDVKPVFGHWLEAGTQRQHPRLWRGRTTCLAFQEAADLPNFAVAGRETRGAVVV